MYILLILGGVVALIIGVLLLKATHKCDQPDDDPFNLKEQSDFPQNEKFYTDEYTINFPTKYFRQGKEHQGWISRFGKIIHNNQQLYPPGIGKRIRNVPLRLQNP